MKQAWLSFAIAAVAALGVVGAAAHLTRGDPLSDASAPTPGPTPRATPSATPGPTAFTMGDARTWTPPPVMHAVLCAPGETIMQSSPTYSVEQTAQGPRLMSGGYATAEDAVNRFLRHTYQGAAADLRTVVVGHNSKSFGFTNIRAAGTQLAISVVRIGDRWIIDGVGGCNDYLIAVSR
jgi:hypothetical protein